jgi:hypothetical protein
MKTLLFLSILTAITSAASIGHADALCPNNAEKIYGCVLTPKEGDSMAAVFDAIAICKVGPQLYMNMVDEVYGNEVAPATAKARMGGTSYKVTTSETVVTLDVTEGILSPESPATMSFLLIKPDETIRSSYTCTK